MSHARSRSSSKAGSEAGIAGNSVVKHTVKRTSTVVLKHPGFGEYRPIYFGFEAGLGDRVRTCLHHDGDEESSKICQGPKRRRKGISPPPGLGPVLADHDIISLST